MRELLVILTAIVSLFGSIFIAGQTLSWLGISEADTDSTAFNVQFAFVLVFSIIVSYLAANAVEGNFSVTLSKVLNFLFRVFLACLALGGLYLLWLAVPVWAFFIITILALILFVLTLIWLNLSTKR
ncbi:hypothetical protein [Motiliproteus sp. SC1-56]|uniref:hypothetical protein n=1 Tax=Motiliproteus sp. SC1-56 TaxID=2799565 RepID=UPI001A8E356B|nr:hypothetical protein [Motiliproteus sp. SC1-56]